jgi:hypothetical protein
VKRILPCVVIAFAAIGCSSDDDDDGGGAPSFDTFVQNLIAGTADDSDPAPINGQNFSFSEDENAFDDLFP